jgi:hypothetical protein
VPTAADFSIPEHLEASLNAVLACWQSLKRADADMPFLDDIKSSELSKLTDIDFLKTPAFPLRLC